MVVCGGSTGCGDGDDVGNGEYVADKCGDYEANGDAVMQKSVWMMMMGTVGDDGDDVAGVMTMTAVAVVDCCCCVPSCNLIVEIDYCRCYYCCYCCCRCSCCSFSCCLVYSYADVSRAVSDKILTKSLTVFSVLSASTRFSSSVTVVLPGLISIILR